MGALGLQDVVPLSAKGLYMVDIFIKTLLKSISLISFTTEWPNRQAKEKPSS
jgi:hypothetical protein